MTIRSAVYPRRKIFWPFTTESISKNLITIGFILACDLVFQKTTAMPSRFVNAAAATAAASADDDNNDGFVFPINDGEKMMKRKTSRSDGAEPRISDIVFPTEETDHVSHIFTPAPAPECQTKTYCEKTDFYPKNYVSNVIKKNDDLKFLAGVDIFGEIVQRIDGDDSTALCTSEERLIHPTAAQNRNNNWLFVVNQEGFEQGVRIETCLSADSECSVISGFADGYKSICKQKYIFRQLAAISENGTLIRDMFRLPSSCCCHIKIDSPYNRIGISLKSTSNIQTPVSSARRRRRVSKGI